VAVWGGAGACGRSLGALHSPARMRVWRRGRATSLRQCAGVFGSIRKARAAQQPRMSLLAQPLPEGHQRSRFCPPLGQRCLRTVGRWRRAPRITRECRRCVYLCVCTSSCVCGCVYIFLYMCGCVHTCVALHCFTVLCSALCMCGLPITPPMTHRQMKYVMSYIFHIPYFVSNLITRYDMFPMM
jgi:hypothetical protein